VSWRVAFPEPGQVELEEFDPGPVGEGQVAVRSRYSLMSTGTELTVLNERYQSSSHWAKWAALPFAPGYACVGDVAEVGAGVVDLEAGDVVVARSSHASRHVVASDACTPLPSSVQPQFAPWFALAKIAFMGALAAEHALGDTVCVIGAGPIGQMAVRWANAAGVRALVAVDTVAGRLELARRGGATAVVAAPVAEAMDQVREHGGPDGVDVVIDATGNPAVFQAALGLVRPRGRVVVLGDTGAPTHQHLTSDVITKGIAIVGAHDNLSRLYPRWSCDRRINDLFFHLVTSGRFDLEGLNTHTFAPQDCAAAYRLAEERRGETGGVLFDWTALEERRP
jgi:2-desacetyl-2-hydroxyethyl bacteriochlorophyllide A dehydrogenase